MKNRMRDEIKGWDERWALKKKKSKWKWKENEKLWTWGGIFHEFSGNFHEMSVVGLWKKRNYLKRERQDLSCFRRIWLEKSKNPGWSLVFIRFLSTMNSQIMSQIKRIRSCLESIRAKQKNSSFIQPRVFLFTCLKTWFSSTFAVWLLLYTTKITQNHPHFSRFFP